MSSRHTMRGLHDHGGGLSLVGMMPVGELLAAESLDEAAGTRVVWPSDVKNRKREIDAKMGGILADLSACPNLDPKTVSDFHSVYGAWRQFYCDSAVQNCTEPVVSIWGLGGQMDDCENWDQTAYDWQQFTAAHCQSSQPVVAPPTPTAQQPDTIGSWLRYGAIIAGVVGGLYVAEQTGILRDVGKLLDHAVGGKGK